MYAASVRVNWPPTRSNPRSMVLATGPTVLLQPKASLHRFQLVDEVFGVIAFIGAQGDADRPVRPGFDHCQRCVPFGMAIRMREAGFNHKGVAVLHQGMAHIAELGLLALALPVEAGIGIGDRSVGLVGALLPVEVHFGIAALVRHGRFSWRSGVASLRRGKRLASPAGTGHGRFASIRFCLGLEALHRSPGFHESAVHGEMFVR